MISSSRAIAVLPFRPVQKAALSDGIEVPRVEEDQPSAGANTAGGRRKPPRAISGMLAPFIAHVIATEQMWPQTRPRNRAEPSAAAAVYRKVASRR